MKSNNELFQESADPLYRFKVFVQEGERKKTVGMAYLREGQNMYTLRLWTLHNEKFFLLPSKDEPTKYLVMTREPNRALDAKSKFHWNIVGNAIANAAQSILELDFDLFEKKIFMSIFPEETSRRG